MFMRRIMSSALTSRLACRVQTSRMGWLDSLKPLTPGCSSNSEKTQRQSKKVELNDNANISNMLQT